MVADIVVVFAYQLTNHDLLLPGERPLLRVHLARVETLRGDGGRQC